MSKPTISLLFHSHKPYGEIRGLVSHALSLGFRSIWINHSKDGDPVGLLNALKRDFGGALRLGVAALNASRLLSADPAELLGRIPPDTTLSVGVGDLRSLPAGVGLAKIVERTVELAEESKSMGFKTLIAAQGPRMLGLARRFDGVMLSFLKPEPVGYARELVGGVEIYGTSPSLVYADGYSPLEYRELLESARYVFEGASPAIKRVFPNIEHYYVFGGVDEVAPLMRVLGDMGVREAILAYPQTMGERTIGWAHKLAGK